jgi:DNA-binding MarR family transcriptional regulator
MKFSLKRGEILRAIKDNEPINVSNLAKKISLSGGTTIYRYLEELKAKGLIEIYQDKKKRGMPNLIKITSKAQPFLDEFYKFAHKWIDF